jgi:hypothetical protein
MRLFSNVPLILLLVVAWPLVLLGLVVACEWLERRTLAPKAVVPRRLRRMRRAEPEQVERMILGETADVVAKYWAATGHPAPPVGESARVIGGHAPATADGDGGAPAEARQVAHVAPQVAQQVAAQVAEPARVQRSTVPPR